MSFKKSIDELQKKLFALKQKKLTEALLWQEADKLIFPVALQLAERSDLQRTKCKIGAIIIDNQTLEILGWASKGLVDHAEAQALAMAEQKMVGKQCTLYTTLEPCVYRTVEGKPTCSSLITQHPEIVRVVIKNLDRDDPKNFRHGIKYLRTMTHKKIDLMEES